MQFNKIRMLNSTHQTLKMTDDLKASLYTENKQDLYRTRVSNIKLKHNNDISEEQCE